MSMTFTVPVENFFREGTKSYPPVGYPHCAKGAARSRGAAEFGESCRSFSKPQLPRSASTWRPTYPHGLL